MGPATVQVLILGTVVRARRTISLLSLRGGLSAISGSAVFHAVALFISRRLTRDMSSNAKSLGCTIYSDRYAYTMGSLRARFCYRCYRGAFYLRGVRIPIISLPRKFTMQDVGCILGNYYTRYTTRLGGSRWGGDTLVRGVGTLF